MTEAEKLLQENLNLVPHVLREKFPWLVYNEDYMQVGMLGLWKAALKYDASKGVPFSSFACICILNEIKLEMRVQHKREPETLVSLNAELEVGKGLTIESLLVDVKGEFADAVALQDVIDKLSKKDKELVGYLMEGLTQREIAQKMGGVSKSAVNMRLGRLRKKVRELYES